MSLQRPPRDYADPRWASRTEVLSAPSTRSSPSVSSNTGEQQRAVTLVGASLALHLALGLIAALVIGPARVVAEGPSLVEMVIVAPPAPPGQVSAPTTAGESSVEPPQAAQPMLVEVAPPSLPVPAAHPPQVPPAAKPQSAAMEAYLPAPVSLSGPSPPEPARPGKPYRQVFPASPLTPPARTAKPAASVRPMPPRPQPTRPQPTRPQPPLRAVQPPPILAMPAAPLPAVSLPELARSSYPPPRADPSAPSFPPATAHAPSPVAVNGAWQSKRYSDEAGRESTDVRQVAVRLTVSRSGQVLDAQITRGSGSERLDKAALSMFRIERASPFPTDTSQPPHTKTVTVRFRGEE
jgi:periplasmic protein TonB